MTVFLATGLAQTGNDMSGICALFAGATVYGPQTATSFGIEFGGLGQIIARGTGFGGYSGNHPTTGVITSWTGFDAEVGEEACVFTGFSLSVASYNAFIATNNDAAMQNAIFGGNDTIVGSSFGGEDFWGFNGNDVLRGGGGADELHGGLGSDTASYSTSPVGVQVNLTTGTGASGDAQGDTFDSIENLTGSLLNDVLTGNSAANILTGADGADNLSGSSGADTLRGGAGHDVLRGGGGADKFVFSSAVAAANSDTISDFTHATDKIHLENSVFTTLGAAGALAAVKFHVGAAAHDSDDRMIYNSTTGRLYYDVDGMGGQAQVLIATLTGLPALTVSDLLVI